MYISRCRGFTLLELMMVVGIMAIVAGVLMVSHQENARDDSQIEVARYEMQQIRHALLRYRRDVGGFESSSMTSPADFSFLFEAAGHDSWDPDYQLGWRGPYLSGGDSGLVDIGDALTSAGVGAAHTIAISAVVLQKGIPDPFVLPSVENGQSWRATPCIEDLNNNDDCLLDWRLVGQVAADLPHDRFGRPYLLFDLTNNDDSQARIMSMGPNGYYESGDIANGSDCAAFIPSGDDLVLCLY